MKKLPLIILMLFIMISVISASGKEKPAVIITQDG
jgi:hypothetical protein